MKIIDIITEKKKEKPVDANETAIKVGDTIARCTGNFGRDVAVQKVTSITEKGVFLDNSKQAMKIPERLLVMQKNAPKRKAKKGESKDYQGTPFKVGDLVARPGALYSGGDGPMMTQAEVTEIRDGKVFLDGKKQAMKVPDRLIIIKGK